MKKICFVTTVYMTYKCFLKQLSQYLYESGEYDISLICNNEEDALKDIPSFVHYHPVDMKRGVSLSAFGAIKKIGEILEREKFDIVQYSTPNAAFYASIAAKKKKVPVRLYCQWGIRYMGFEGWKRSVFKYFTEKMIKNNVDIKNKTILITGTAGFIGSNLVMELLREVDSVHIIGVDNMNDYYDVSIKEYRLQQIEKWAAQHPESSWNFIRGSIADKALIDQIFEEHKPAVVVNLAAQAGVRYSITNPDVYVESNMIGFYNILEACRHSYDDGQTGVEHLVYASSSSVYGSNKKVPYSTEDKVDNPVSLYAATKKSNELMAHAYSKLYDIPSTGLRFFTVYGPAGRPDMAYFGFTNKLKSNDTIQIFNYGNCKRDFTYVDDIVEGIKRVMQVAPEKVTGEDGLPVPPYKVYNIGNSHPENLLEFVDILQQELIRAGVLSEDYDFEEHKKLVPMQPGDVPVTYTDTTALEEDFGFKPQTSLRTGLRKFTEWYKEFYK